MIDYTLKMCTGDVGPEQSFVLFSVKVRNCLTLLDSKSTFHTLAYIYVKFETNE